MNSTDSTDSGPLASPPALPALDNTFGAFMVGTFGGSILYGLVLHQVYRYFRLYPHDKVVLKTFVISLFIVETLHIVMCMQSCYVYLITNNNNPLALLIQTWAIKLLPLVTSMAIVTAQSFFAYRVYLLRPKYKPLIIVSMLFAIAGLACAIVASVDGFRVPTFQKWVTSERKYEDSGFAATMISDLLTTSVLIFVLRDSRTGLKQTDHVIDRLIQYAVNTGLLTVIVDALCLAFSLAYPNALIDVGISIVEAGVYANSVLAVLNTRLSLNEALLEPEAITMTSFKCDTTRHDTLQTASYQWDAQQQMSVASGSASEVKVGGSSPV